MDPERARMVKARRTHLAYGDTLEKFYGMELSDVEFTYRAWYLAHRVDLHNELKFLATRTDDEGFPAKIVTGTEVVAFDTLSASITLANGDTEIADVIVAADGVHSQATRHILGHDNLAAPTGMSAFRFLIPSDVLRDDPETASFLEDDAGRFKIFTGTGDRRLVWYPCRKYVVSA